MCPTRIETKLEPIELDLSKVFDFERGIGRADLLKLAPALDEARRRLVTDEGKVRTIASPGDYLDHYKARRRSSLLGQLLGAAKRMRDGVDQVVIVGAPPLIACAKMIFAACCHPYHNELSRGERGGRPRIYFAPADLDNDALQGLLDLLPREHISATSDDGWGLIVIDDDRTQSLSAVASILCETLKRSLSPNEDSARAILVGSPAAEPGEFAGGLVFQIIAERCVVPSWDAGVLLAGAVMGMDVVKLLRGGAALYERFLNAPVGNNPALDLAGMVHLLSRANAGSYSIETHEAALKPLASLIGRGRGGQQLLVHVVSGAVRRDRLRVKLPTNGGRGRETLYLPEVTTLCAEAVWTARSQGGQPTAVVRLPASDEYAIGQLIQLFMLADVLIQLLTAP